jgi:membrane-bound metal-dependent hydrolase YbcI (DUF457 family)
MNVGWLVFASLLADFLLGIFASLGLEHTTVPADYARRHYLLFTFPYSHGFGALLLWSLLLGLLLSRALGFSCRRVWIVIALVALSHFLLDGLVHVAGLPLLGQNSPKFGLALWNNMPLELSLETVMAAIGLLIYWGVCGSAQSRLSRYGIALFVLLVTAMTWTQLLLTTAPKPRQLSVSWIVVPVVFSAIAYGLDRGRVRRTFSLAD